MWNYIFLIRAYNDYDCRLPLIIEANKQMNSQVTILSFPTNNDINYIQSFNSVLNLPKNIAVCNIFEIHSSFLVRFLGKLHRILALCSFMDNYFVLKLKKVIFTLVNYLAFKFYTLDTTIELFFRNSIVLIDEIIFTHNRSSFVDRLRQHYLKDKSSYKLTSIQTGQNIFLNLDFKDNPPSGPIANAQIPFYVSGPNDRLYFENRYSLSNILVFGNTRYDRDWINRLSKIPNNDMFLDRICDNKKVIVLMLSKLEYGVSVDNIILTINRLSELENCVVLIKPHTRGMSLSEIPNLEISENTYDASRFNSTTLIGYGDINPFF